MVDGVKRPILYMSQALNDHELNYGITDKEGCAATWAIRQTRGYLRGAQVVLITDHSVLLPLVKGGPMRSMRQQRYAMDLSEYSLTIKHRAGAQMHLADALSRCGYSRKWSESVVNEVRTHPVEECTVESMAQYFKPELQQKKLEARMRATEDGETMVQLCNRLQHAALTEKLVPESEEEESRTVEFYDMVMHVPQSRRGSRRPMPR